MKKCYVAAIALAISSLSGFLIQSPVKAGASQSRICNTGQYLVFTKWNTNGQLVYKAFQGNYSSNEEPNQDPNLILYNGRNKYINGGSQEVRTWTAGGGYTYQIIGPSEQGGGDTRSFLIVKRKNKVIVNQQCQ